MNKQNPHTESLKGKIDWSTAVIPFVLIAFLCISFMAAPDSSRQILDKIRALLGDTFGLYYLVIGLGVFLLSIYLAFSRYGSIRLGGPNENPKYSDFAWSSMMFTAGLAADILFYSFCEWILYANDPHIAEMGSMQIWSSTYPIFHWGPIPWSFYLVLAVAFGFMLHVRGCHKQKYSEACRPLLGDRVDKLPGKCIDLLALFALLAGTATTFSLATPLMAQVLSRLTGLPSSKWVTIGILVVTCIIYTYALVHGMKGISRLSAACMYLFFALLAYVLLAGGETRYILETGFSAIGNLAQNFFSLATFTDPQRTTSFPQTWTIFYWAYWMVWCVASPFFIGSISRGRTVKQTILGGYVYSLGGTFLSFLILGNYSLGLQVSGKLDVLGIYGGAGDLYSTIIAIVDTLPLAPMVLVLLIAAMIAFYATSFDSIALVASSYTYKQMTGDEEPHRAVKFFWAVMLILFPIALVFSESSMANLQTVSIIAAFPVALVILLIIASFLKDAGRYLDSSKK